ncbi:MAG: hypothetical protein RLY31_3180 [Bacteroidota bacterium]
MVVAYYLAYRIVSVILSFLLQIPSPQSSNLFFLLPDGLEISPDVGFGQAEGCPAIRDGLLCGGGVDRQPCLPDRRMEQCHAVRPVASDEGLYEGERQSAEQGHGGGIVTVVRELAQDLGQVLEPAGEAFDLKSFFESFFTSLVQ